MMAKLIVEGKEFDIEILDPALDKLLKPAEKKTGYERVDEGSVAYLGYIHPEGTTANIIDDRSFGCDYAYDIADYYSDETVAQNNARADKLMRQLRRFAVEHRKEKLDWNDTSQDKYYSEFDQEEVEFNVDGFACFQELGTVFFDSDNTAWLAIDTFRDELMWYFTEYRDSL